MLSFKKYVNEKLSLTPETKLKLKGKKLPDLKKCASLTKYSKIASEELFYRFGWDAYKNFKKGIAKPFGLKSNEIPLEMDGGDLYWMDKNGQTYNYKSKMGKSLQRDLVYEILQVYLNGNLYKSYKIPSEEALDQLVKYFRDDN